jgi:glycosyltransferase involved in cell wall biosynthesis
MPDFRRWAIFEAFRSHFDVGRKVREVFSEARASADYQQVFEKNEPLVTVCIATRNRSRLLSERSLPSILRQTYQKLDIVVVGDCCTDDTEEKIAAIGDNRVRFVNLPRRGDYPMDPGLRWMVAGTAALNHALSLAAGDFITHLDDDDEHAPDRVAKLVQCIQSTRADLLFHPFDYETQDGSWLLNEANEFAYGRVTTSSVFYHRWLRQLDWDPLAYRYGEPGDWNRFRRMKAIGATLVRHDQALLKHYKERNQPSTEDASADAKIR